MRRWLLLLAACGSTPAGNGGLVADMHDLAAPSRIAAVTFDDASRPVVLGSEDGQTYAVERLDATGWTAAPMTFGTVGLHMFPGVVVVAQGDGYDLWKLTDAASFSWTQISVPNPPCTGAWNIVGQDASGVFYALVQGDQTLVMFTWSIGDKDWVQIPGTSEAGLQQGVVVTPNGSVYLYYSPPATEDFDDQWIHGSGPVALTSCDGSPTVIAENGVVDAASDVFFEVCEANALYVIPAGGGCYQKVADLPPNTCGLTGVAPDGTAFIFPTLPGETRILRLMPGETKWDEIRGDGVDGSSGFIARDATTLFRFGGIRPGLAEADL